MYRWLNYKGKWKPVKIDGPCYKFFELTMKFPLGEVPEDLWGPFILEPRYVEVRPHRDRVISEEISEVKNAADKEIHQELQGEMYLCPDFVVNSKRGKDCPVVAVANILGLTYTQAKLKCFHAGWSSSIGLVRGFCDQIIMDEEFYVFFRKDLSFGKVQDFRSKGTFLVYCLNHVMPARNHIVHNQRGNGDMSIQEVYEIRKK